MFKRPVPLGKSKLGMLQKDSAERLGISPRTISKWKQKFRATGDVKDRPRSGRPKITTEQQDRSIRILLYWIVDDRQRVFCEALLGGSMQGHIWPNSEKSPPCCKYPSTKGGKEASNDCSTEASGGASTWVLHPLLSLDHVNWWNQRSQSVTIKMEIHSNQAPCFFIFDVLLWIM